MVKNWNALINRVDGHIVLTLDENRIIAYVGGDWHPIVDRIFDGEPSAHTTRKTSATEVVPVTFNQGKP